MRIRCWPAVVIRVAGVRHNRRSTRHRRLSLMKWGTVSLYNRNPRVHSELSDTIAVTSSHCHWHPRPKSTMKLMNNNKKDVKMRRLDSREILCALHKPV